MRLLDKIALNRLLSMIMNFIISIMKFIYPKSINPDTKKPKRKIFPRWRKNE